jgi:hypothetical protein
VLGVETTMEGTPGNQVTHKEGVQALAEQVLRQCFECRHCRRGEGRQRTRIVLGDTHRGEGTSGRDSTRSGERNPCPAENNQLSLLDGHNQPVDRRVHSRLTFPLRFA